MKDALLLLALALLIGCAPRLEPAGTDTIAPGYAVGGGEWDSGGGITAVARIFEQDGQTIVCGAWMTDRQSALSTLYNEDIVAAGSIFAGRIQIAQNLWFMRRLPYSQSLSGEPANCAYSGLRWTAALSTAPVRIRFPRLSFGGGSIGGLGVGGVGVGPGSGDRVTFREGPRPHPIR